MIVEVRDMRDLAVTGRKFDFGHFSTDEALLVSRPLDEVLRVAAAQAVIDAEETTAVDSTRPTVPVFHGEPWT
jgi:hypothetical protein